MGKRRTRNAFIQTALLLWLIAAVLTPLHASNPDTPQQNSTPSCPITPKADVKEIGARVGPGNDRAILTPLALDRTYEPTNQRDIGGVIWYEVAITPTTIVWVDGTDFDLAAACAGGETAATPVPATTTTGDTSGVLCPITPKADVKEIGARVGPGNDRAILTPLALDRTYNPTNQRDIGGIVWYEVAITPTTIVWVDGTDFNMAVGCGEGAETAATSVPAVTETASTPVPATTGETSGALCPITPKAGVREIGARVGPGNDRAILTPLALDRTYNPTNQRDIGGVIWYEVAITPTTIVWVDGTDFDMAVECGAGAETAATSVPAVTETASTPVPATTGETSAALCPITPKAGVREIGARVGPGNDRAILTPLALDRTYNPTNQRDISGVIWYELAITPTTIVWVDGTNFDMGAGCGSTTITEIVPTAASETSVIVGAGCEITPKVGVREIAAHVGPGNDRAILIPLALDRSYEPTNQRDISGVVWFELAITPTTIVWVDGTNFDMAAGCAGTTTVAVSTTATPDASVRTGAGCQITPQAGAREIPARVGPGNDRAILTPLSLDRSYDPTDQRDISGVIWYEVSLSPTTIVWVDSTSFDLTAECGAMVAVASPTPAVSTGTGTACQITPKADAREIAAYVGPGYDRAILTALPLGKTYQPQDSVEVGDVMWFEVALSTSLIAWVEAPKFTLTDACGLKIEQPTNTEATAAQGTCVLQPNPSAKEIPARVGPGSDRAVRTALPLNVTYEPTSYSVVGGVTWYEVQLLPNLTAWVDAPNFVVSEGCGGSQAASAGTTGADTGECALKPLPDLIEIKARIGPGYDRSLRTTLLLDEIYHPTSTAVVNNVTWFEIELSSTLRVWVDETNFQNPETCKS